MTLRSLRLAALTTLVLAAIATAAIAATGTAKLSPSTPKSASTATVTITGPLTAGLPSALSVAFQKGFSSSLKSTAALCTASAGAAGTCPATSKVGTAQIAATVPILGSTTVTLQMWQGAPTVKGDISTIYLYGTIDGQTLATTARMFHYQGGVSLLIAKFPQLPASLASLKVTINSLVLTLGAKHKVGSKTYGFITNPPACKGKWTGKATATFTGSAPVVVPFSTPCKK